MDPDCVCGHAEDEHESHPGGAGYECDVPGCDCIHYEPAEEDRDG